MTSLCKALLALVVSLLLWTVPQTARAGAYEDAVAKFTSDSYADTEAAVAGVAESGHAKAQLVIEALRSNVLFVGGGKVAIRDQNGAFQDVATGEALEASLAVSLKPVRVNNRVRRAVDAALGTLTLLSPETSKRLDAAGAVFRSRDVAALPALTRALTQESDDRVRTAMIEARAAIILNKPDSTSADRLSAVETLRNLGNQNALALLANIPAGASPDIVGRPAPLRNRLPPTLLSGMRFRTSGTESLLARSCCWLPSGSPSPLAQWASSTWPMARW